MRVDESRDAIPPLMSAVSTGVAEQAVVRRGSGGIKDTGVAAEAAAPVDGREFPTR